MVMIVLLLFTVKSSHTDMDRFVVSIKEKYRERLINYEKQWPPCKTEKLVHLELVESQTVKGCENQRGRKEEIKRTPIAYGSLFRVESGRKPVRKILVEGDAGIGKTTLCTALSEDWADNKLFQQFELLLLLPLRDKDISIACSIPELIQLLHSDPEVQDSVTRYLEKEEGKNVLIIADGWDELGKANCQAGSFMYKLLFGKLLSFVSVVLTSRPTASAPLHQLPYFDRFVEVHGFNNDNIKEYIQSEFAGDEEKACHLLEQLESNPLLESVCSVPINCAIICHLWRILREALPTTMTDLYTKIILNLILRNIHKIPAYENIKSLSSFSTLPEDLQQSWQLLCEFAFLYLEKDQLVFSVEELSEFFPQGLALDEKILCFGLLQSTEPVVVVGHGVSFHFLHLTFQEYLCALHLVNQPTGVQLEILKSHAESKHFTMVWRFFFGIGFRKMHKNEGETVINQLVQSLSTRSRLTLCHCTFEAHNEFVSSEVIKGLETLHFGSDCHSACDCAAVVYIIDNAELHTHCLLYTSPSPRDATLSRMPSSA